jgi:X-Pro dipeptidyl-peptidase C-terminal non-catalytic domain
MWPAGHRFGAGHRLQVQVSSGAHPVYARNLGTGDPPVAATLMRPADQAIHHEPGRLSSVVIPHLQTRPARRPDDVAAGQDRTVHRFQATPQRGPASSGHIRKPSSPFAGRPNRRNAATPLPQQLPNPPRSGRTASRPPHRAGPQPPADGSQPDETARPDLRRNAFLHLLNILRHDSHGHC